MARGRTSPFARGADNKFVTLAMEAKGMRKAAAEIEKVAKETEKLKNKTKEASSATDANTASTDTNTTSKGKNKKEHKHLIDEQTRGVIMLQATTSALNQGTGATYKMIAGLEAMGRVTNEQALAMQKFVRQAEFFTGALELGLSVVTIQTTMTEMNTTAKVKNAKATEQQTVANAALNKSLMNNPYVALAVGLVSVVAMLVIFERETGKVTDAIRFLNKELKELVTFFIELGGIADNNPIKRLVESSSMKKLNDMTRLEVLGVG